RSWHRVLRKWDSMLTLIATISAGSSCHDTLLRFHWRGWRRAIGAGCGWCWFDVFGFAYRGDAVYVETLIVGIAGDLVDFESLNHKDANADVGLFIRRQPHLIVHELLLECEARALLKIGHETACKSEITDEVGLQANDVVSFLVNPNDAC